jgi:hypothetical protein
VGESTAFGQGAVVASSLALGGFGAAGELGSAVEALGGSDASALAGASEEGAALDTTPAGRVYSAHYLYDNTGDVRNIPGSVVDETIDYGQVVEKLPDRTVYYDVKNDLTVVQSDTTGKIMSARRGHP